MIDGTIVVALLTVLAAHRVTAKAGYPWALAVLFSLASVAFNIAHAPDRPVARLVFAMAPVALVLTTHLLMQQAGWRHRPAGTGHRPDPDLATTVDVDLRPVRTVAAAGVPRQPHTTSAPRTDHAGPDPDVELGMADHRPDTTGPEVTSQAAMPVPQPDLQAQARQLYKEYQAAGRRMSGAALGRQLGTSERHGRRLLAEFRAKEQGSAGHNGDGVARNEQAGSMPK